jgi:hypothetical protein
MPRFKVQRRVYIKEEAILDLDVPDFLSTKENRDFYITQFAEANKTLVWRESFRCPIRFNEVELADSDELTPTVINVEKRAEGTQTRRPWLVLFGIKLL